MSMEGWAFAQIRTAVKQMIDNELKDIENYEKDSLENIGDKIANNIMKKQLENNTNFKYIVNCMISEKKASECGLHGTCFWNPDLDGSITCTWQNDKIVVLICLYALAL